MAVPSFLFGGNTQETPQSIKQKRDLVRAIMGASNAPKNIGEGLNALGDGIVANVLDRRANAAEKAGTDAANSLFNNILGTPSANPGSSGSSMPAVSSTGDVGPVAPVGSSEIADYIRQSATARGIDPETALRVAKSEGGFSNPVQQSNYVKDGVRETSYGPFQLRIGGGLGDAALKAGIDPRDPNQWKKGVDFALDQAATGGWSPWYGAAKVGVAARTGLQGARALGGPQSSQVASLDPSIGMPDAAQEMGASNPAPANIPVPSPRPQSASAVKPLNEIGVLDSGSQVQQPKFMPPQQVAQNDRFGGVDPRLLQALQNPWLNEGQKATIQLLIQQQQQTANQAAEQQTWEAREKYKLAQERADPGYQLEQDYKRAQLEALKNKTGKSNLINAGEGNIYDPDTGTWIKAPNTTGQSGSGFRFGGNSVEAQALNGLIESGQLTPDQAQQLGAGKTITDPSTGAMMFLTPQGIFKHQDQPPAPQPQQQPSVDLFGDSGQQAPQSVDLFGPSAAAPSPQPAAPAQAAPAAVAPPAQNVPATPAAPATNNGIIPLTGGKPQKLLTEAERKNQSLFSVIQPELKTVEDNFDALSELGNQAYSKLPFSEFATTPEYQKAANSLQTIVSSYLYSVSGATATPEEVRKQTDILTPRPGESKESIDAKKRRVRTMVNAVATAGSLPPLEEPAATPSQAENPLPPTPQPQGQRPRAANPATGEIIEFDGTKWVPVQ